MSTDLPVERNRWLINVDTGQIEAWDHGGNPKSGDDPHALALAIADVRADGWTHPSYTKEEAREAVLRTIHCIAEGWYNPKYSRKE